MVAPRAAGAATFDPSVEAKDDAITFERQALVRRRRRLLQPGREVGVVACLQRGGCRLRRHWRHDATEAQIDPSHDGNAFSFYYPSRLDITLTSGQRWTCEDLRPGCAGMGPDGRPAAYSYLVTDTTRDAATGPGATIAAPGPDNLYRENLTPTQIARLALLLPKNLLFTIQHGFLF